jgi:predicted GIY-YIG superfamily endonuclease
MAKKNMQWKEAVFEVLKGSSKPMHYAEIADEIVAKQLRSEVGATPASTVNVVIHESIKKEGAESPFVKVGIGEFILKTALPHGETAETGQQAAQLDEEKDTGGIIKAFGMYWQRDWVEWAIKPALMGQQHEGADSVNFTDQIGVYLLHDGREVVYVGRTTEKRLGTRLSEHTRDRLNGRWDRFSWFGLLAVTDVGKLDHGKQGAITDEDIIVTLEALLIEGLEPRQNRKRGDAFRAVEYLQVQDPEIIKENKKKVLEEAIKKLG